MFRNAMETNYKLYISLYEYTNNEREKNYSHGEFIIMQKIPQENGCIFLRPLYTTLEKKKMEKK